ncbi:hypothetical protein [Photorhabdus sp. SF281]|uniref:hypothetical protein n=1 Tax=Photorhabdus sp. SF281 TaxID=3459527 RepID=UPI0040443CB1
MKRPLITLILLILAYGLTCSFGLVALEWILTDKNIYQLDWIKGFKMGSTLGGAGGAIIWLAYRFRWL